MSTLIDLLPPQHSEKLAVVIPGNGPKQTFSQLNEQVSLLRNILRKGGIGPADPISIILPNGLEFISIFLAVTGIRAIACPLNSAYTTEEFLFYMEDSGARAVILPQVEHPARNAAKALNIPIWDVNLNTDGTVRLQPPQKIYTPRTEDPPKPSDIALFLHTSGTTSRPKGVPLTHKNLLTSLKNIVNTYNLSPQDTGLVVMPLFHVHGLIGSTLAPLSAGSSIIIPQRFSASHFWNQVQEHSANWYTAVPTIHQILLSRADKDLAPSKTFRFIRSCSAALAPSVLTRLENRFDAPVLEAYAMTEASHQMSSNPLPPKPHKAGSVGTSTGTEIKLLDEKGNDIPNGLQGEVSIRGNNVTKGYLNNTKANADAFINSWFRTGDQGFFDSDNYLTLTGRIKELINRGGEKISPLEVDAVLLEHPEVEEAVCFGVPDEKYGEEVHAAVVLKGDSTETDLISFCRNHLADFKTPKVLHIADAVPKTATGKIQRRHVAAHFQK